MADERANSVNCENCGRLVPKSLTDCPYCDAPIWPGEKPSPTPDADKSMGTPGSPIREGA
jgi:hypothetical protein